MIKVLVVDDSAVAREVLTHLINGSADMTVVGCAANGAEAIEAAERLRPNIITMDIIMPVMDGPAAIDAIMHRFPTPIVVVTGNTITEEVRATFQSLDSGALAIIPRPQGMDTPEHEASREQLLQTLRLMAEVKVVRRLKRRPGGGGLDMSADLARRPRPLRLVAIGASTGGPSALKTLLGGLRPDFPVPILVVQHIAAGFVDGFAQWLRDSTPLQVMLARDGETPKPGMVYVAPDGVHLTVSREERIVLQAPTTLSPEALCPSATALFDSVATCYRGECAGVLLTGMGRDGADGLLTLKRLGALTIAQDKESSVIHGMPGEAIALGAAEWIAPPARIAELLTTFAGAQAPSR